MALNQQIETAPNGRRQVTPLAVLLALTTMLFCAILIFVYVATKRANPVMLDLQGRPLHQSSRRAK